MAIKIHLTPPLQNFPPRGGVREHLYQLHKQLTKSDAVMLVNDPNEADILHVESAWTIPSTLRQEQPPVVYVCHGGFVPEPIGTVLANLQHADIIISVSKWIVDKYFPEHKAKTKVIPNGVDLSEFRDIPEPKLQQRNYILYAKEWTYFYDDFLLLAASMPQYSFLSVVDPYKADIPPELGSVPGNVLHIGQYSRDEMRSILNKAVVLLLTGSEVCPTMLFEAWACGVPVLGKAIDGNVEFMKPNGTQQIGGLLYSDISDGIQALVYCIVKGPEYGARGREQVRNFFQWDDLFQEYLKVYKELI